jgi:hypothetical protein
VLELLPLREKSPRRETKLNGILLFVHTAVWKALFGKQADLLEKDDDHDNHYMITDHEMIVNRYVSVPRDMGDLNCASFVAGIVEAVLEGAHFPASVSAHNSAATGTKGVTLLIKFDLSALPPNAVEA